MRLVEREQLADVDVGEAVAVGREEALPVDVLLDPRDAAAGRRLGAGVDHRDHPVGLEVGVVVLDLVGAPEPDREVVGPRLVVEEVVADHVAAVADGHDELDDPSGARRAS